MTKSIKVNDDGTVATIFNGSKSGDDWIQMPDDEFPTVDEDDVSKTYTYDGSSVAVTTEPIPEDDNL